MVAAILKRPRTPPTNNPAMDYQSADSEHVLKRSRPFGMPDEVSVASNIFSCLYLDLPHELLCNICISILIWINVVWL